MTKTSLKMLKAWQNNSLTGKMKWKEKKEKKIIKSGTELHQGAFDRVETTSLRMGRRWELEEKRNPGAEGWSEPGWPPRDEEEEEQMSTRSGRTTANAGRNVSMASSDKFLGKSFSPWVLTGLAKIMKWNSETGMKFFMEHWLHFLSRIDQSKTVLVWIMPNG